MPIFARLVLMRLAQAVPVLLVAAAAAVALASLAGGPRDRPAPDAPPVRYARFLWHAAQGDFGLSTRSGRPVGALIAERLPATLQRAATALLLALVVGVPGGMLAAAQRDTCIGRAILSASLLAAWLSVLVTGMLLIPPFAATLRWPLRFGAAGDTYGGGALVLPVVTLFQAALLLLRVRAGMVAALDSDMVRFARARGLPRSVVLWHALANALVPVAKASATQLGLLLAFAVVTEAAFQCHGIGLLLARSLATADMPVLAACLVLAVPLFVALRLTADLLCHALDPRLRRPA